MTIISEQGETILDYLIRMFVKDRSKGYEIAGLRDTLEIAEYFNMDKVQTRRTLHRLYGQGLVTCCEARPLLWAASVRALQGRPLQLELRDSHVVL